MKDNPFTSGIFSKFWSKHFDKPKKGVNFPFIKNLQFLKRKFLPLYSNYGKTHTKGINYSVDTSLSKGLKGKTLLIYDVPTYFKINPELKPSSLRLHKIGQYPGFLINLEGFKNINEYISATFKGKSRNKLKRDKRRLEHCFDITYQMYYGKTSKEEYDAIFERFKILLEKRYDEKGIYNNNLDPEEWDFYNEVAYPMIQDKKACLFVVKERGNPICIMLNFLSHDSLYQFIMVFDIDYAKFNVGTTSLMKLIEWSMEMKVKIFDFSKGYFHYKKRWSNLEYRFEYHLLYDSKSFLSKLLATYLKNYFVLKQFLRAKKVNELLHNFKLHPKTEAAKKAQRFTFLETNGPLEKKSLKPIDFHNQEQQHLKPIVYDFLYYNSEVLKDIEVYILLDNTSRYLIVGRNKSQIIQME